MVAATRRGEIEDLVRPARGRRNVIIKALVLHHLACLGLACRMACLMGFLFLELPMNLSPDMGGLRALARQLMATACHLLAMATPRHLVMVLTARHRQAMVMVPRQVHPEQGPMDPTGHHRVRLRRPLRNLLLRQESNQRLLRTLARPRQQLSTPRCPLPRSRAVAACLL